MVLKLPEFLPSQIRTHKAANKMDNFSLKRLSHTRIYKQGTRLQVGEEAGGKLQGKLTGSTQKLKEPRAININPSQFKQEQRNLMTVLTEKCPEFAPTTRAAGGQGQKSRADPAFPAGEGRFLGSRSVLEQEKKEKSKFSH
ncbi:hypothetical protein SLEP1_g3757 [Rubroshorea leprosula]|uniref:Uncharacterized protein n=1 Tax=Rubroshorea leprosula TaxID=152421 RepID=A0AAV5HM01_9ROSI|nr:hypothetical protein SLEP1_g3757 [Rubroshorea leprosula]